MFQAFVFVDTEEKKEGTGNGQIAEVSCWYYR